MPMEIRGGSVAFPGQSLSRSREKDQEKRERKRKNELLPKMQSFVFEVAATGSPVTGID